MSLKDIALPLINRGIRVVPARPGQNRSTLKGWPELASTDPAVIAEWDCDYPGWNLVCMAHKDDVGILDVDDMDAAEDAMMPNDFYTFSVNTPRPGRHLYFLHTDKSRALGNRVVCGGAVEFKAHRKTTCAPGCTRNDEKYTNGRYRIHDPSPLIPIPDHLVKWIDDMSVKTQSGAVDLDKIITAEGFDFDEFCDFYDINIVNVSGNWHSPRYCPVKGDSHSSLTDCGFFWDGEHLGWKDHAANCEGSQMGIKKLIAYLIKDSGKMYPHKIFEDTVDADWAEDIDAIEEVEGEEAPAEVKPVDPEVAKLGERARRALEKTASCLAVAEAPEDGSTLTAEQLMAIFNDPEIRFPHLKYPDLRFSCASLEEGNFKKIVDKACEGGMEPGLIVPAIMALASAIPFRDKMDDQRINLYVCLLALVGAGKDIAIKRAIDVLGLTDEDFIINYTPNGERAIATMIGDKPGTKANPGRKPGISKCCFVTEEIEETLKKARAETSGVLEAMQRFYDHNKKSYVDSRNGDIMKVDCRLSWLTAMPVGNGEIDPKSFRLAFGDNTSHGIGSRMIFGFSEKAVDPRDFHRNKWTPETYPSNFAADDRLPPPSIMEMIRNAQVSKFDDDALQRFYDWKPPENAHWGREIQQVHKVSILTAILNYHQTITLDDWKFAQSFIAWQGRIREVFSSGRAQKVSQGEFQEIIVEEMVHRSKRRMKPDAVDSKTVQLVKMKSGDAIFVRWRGMANEGRWYKYGMDVEKIIDSLVRSGTLAYMEETETSEDGKKEKKVSVKTWVRLVKLSQYLK